MTKFCLFIKFPPIISQLFKAKQEFKQFLFTRDLRKLILNDISLFADVNKSMSHPGGAIEI